ncbi:DUF4376 domain-containing protein [Cytobacillus firmus]|nr:DUF4376 domain-containing protein [Cytobacillus firmus]
MKIYIETGEGGKVGGWADSPFSPSCFEVEVEEGHEFFDNPFAYSYIEEVLVKDSERVVIEAKIQKFRELSTVCQADILGYFEATVNSVAYLFSFDTEAQGNFNGTLTFFSEGLIDSVEWTAYLNGQRTSVTLNKEQFFSVAKTAFATKNFKISKLREKHTQLEACTSLEEIEAVKW